MSDVYVDENGTMRRHSDVELADRAIELKNKGELWGVVDLLLKAWAERAPDEVAALRVQVEDHREMLTDKEFGTTKDGKDFDRRFTLEFPHDLMLMLRQIYTNEELQFDGKFFKEFGKRYPVFKVAAKD